MKAEIEAETFSDALKIAAGLTRGNSHLMVYGCVLIEAQPDGIYVTGGHGEAFVQVPAGGEVQEPGATAVPAKTVARAVSLMDGPLTLSLDDDGALGIDTMTSRITLPTADPTEYPKVEWPEDESFTDITEAWDMLAKITYAADGQTPRQKSVTLLAAGYAESWGGTRLAHCPTPEGLEVPIARSTLEYAFKTFTETTVLLHAGPRGVCFSGRGIRIWSSLPQYEVKPMPGIDFPTVHSFTIDRKALLEGFGLMEVVKEGDAVPVRIDVKDGELHMHASSPGQGFVATVIPVEGDLPYPTGLTLAHARDAISRCGSEKITLHFSAEPNKPIRLTDDGVTHILNPNRAAVERIKVDL